MAHSQELYACVVASLARHQDIALRPRCETEELLAATQQTLAQSRALVAEADTLLASDATQTGWLWPAPWIGARYA
jgi:hypothetical protein